MSSTLPEAWQKFLIDAGYSPELWELPLETVRDQRKTHTVFPPENKVFSAFAITPPENVRVVLLGQDPYHDEGQAEGLAFSVPDGIKLPPSLKNIFKEYSNDLNLPPPKSGHLGHWAKNGVLLINAILTVNAHSPGSHTNFGWEKFTDAVIHAVNKKKNGVVFILWGNAAGQKAAAIDKEKHTVIVSAHPSPLSAYRGFFGSKPFSRTVNALENWKWE